MNNFSTTLGTWKIDKLFETELVVSTHFLFPELAGEPGSDKPLTLSVHTFVLRNGRQTILVDTAIGNGKHRPQGAFFDHLNTPYLARMDALGVAPASVDFVLFTHLHVDHVGWNTQMRDGGWHLTFPNARHLCTSGELRAYVDPAALGPENSQVLAYEDSVRPVLEAGLIDTVVADGREVLPGISFLSAPGHSIDHSVIRLADGANVALFVGDLMHHPLQVARPELSSTFCLNQSQARRSREQFLAMAAEQNALVFPAHFDGRSAGRVQPRGHAYAWEPQI